MDDRTADTILALALDLKADAAEVFLRKSTATTIEVKDQKVDAFERASECGAGLRVIVGGRPGFSFTTELGARGLASLALAAVTNARTVEPDPFATLPERSAEGYHSVATYDPALISLTESEQIGRVMAMEREAYALDKRVRRIRKASASFSRTETHIQNSRGAMIDYQNTACSSSIEVVAEDRGESQAGSDFDITRFYGKLQVEEVARRAAQRAIDLLGARSIDSIKAPVVLDATVAQEFLSVLAGAFSAESVQKKRSLLMGKLDQQVMSSIITVYDDGLLEGGLGTTPADDEAVPIQRKTVISDGRLLLFLHNTYTARKDRTLSTGNGMRGGFKGVPGVGITNLYIEPGECTQESIIEQAERGLLVTEVMGMHTANPISGDFSVGATGFWIENGAKAYPVREVTIAGNILDLMSNVDVVGCDLRFSGRIGSPSLLIKEISIGGK